MKRLKSAANPESGTTTYTYDVLDNLTKVKQGTQTPRTFIYDSLKRLVQAVNPESGTIKYEYDDDGNLTKKIDPRKVTTTPLVYVETTFTYDALNRLTSKSYNDNTTANVLYKYDNQVLPAGAPGATIFQRGESTGRLVSVTYGGTAAGTYYGYDSLGRVIERVQRTDLVNYEVTASYNRSGAMATETYPAVAGATDRRVVTHSFDGAGRLSSLTSSATSYADGASVSAINYAAHGALDNETYGNNLLHQVDYNSRLQPTSIKVGTTAAQTSIVNLTYSYGGTANNGKPPISRHKLLRKAPKGTVSTNCDSAFESRYFASPMPKGCATARAIARACVVSELALICQGIPTTETSSLLRLSTQRRT